MLVRVAVTLFPVEAEEVWVDAAAPVSARITTRVRTVSFIMVPVQKNLLNNLLIIKCLRGSIRLVPTHPAGVGIARIANRNGKHARPSRGNLVLGGGGGCQGCSSGTSEDEDDDDSADNDLHDGSP